MNELTEQQIRALRDEVYGKPITDGEWQRIGHRWLTADSIQWLVSKRNVKRGIQLGIEIEVNQREGR